MRVILNLPDTLADFYQHEADDRTRDLNSVLEERLGFATPLDPRIRTVVVQNPTLHFIEQTIGGGHLRDEADLLSKVKRLAAIRFGEHEITLTPGQLEEVAWRAKKQGKSVEQIIQQVYEKFAEDFFTLMPAKG